MKHSQHLLTIILFLLFSIRLPAASLFSPFNRYELSYNYFDAVRQQISDTATPSWFSLYHSHPEVATNIGILFTTKKQSINMDFAGLAGLEYFTKSSRFGTLRGNIDYVAPFLKAYLSLDVYTTEQRADSPINDIQFERFIKTDFNQPISGVFDFRFNLPEAYLESTIKFLTLSIGKKKVRWGPGYKGTLGLSGTNYSPFYYYHLNLKFGTLFNMTAFLCGYDDESIYRQELSINESIIVKNNNKNLKSFFPRYGAGQRLDIRIGKYVQIGVYELVDFFGSNELNRFANPLQLYYLSNETSGTNNANLFGGIDFNILINRFRFYGECLNDDVTFLDDAGNPNKYAYQFGGVFYGKKQLIQTGVEYTHIARYVYGHSRVISRHAHWGESMGWPWGNYQDVFTAHALFALPKNIYGKVEGNVWIKGSGKIEDDWYADDTPDLDHAPYWPENATTIFSAILSAQYSPFSWLTYTLYWEPVIRNESLENGIYTYLLVRLPVHRTFKVK